MEMLYAIFRNTPTATKPRRSNIRQPSASPGSGVAHYHERLCIHSMFAPHPTPCLLVSMRCTRPGNRSGSII